MSDEEGVLLRYQADAIKVIEAEENDVTVWEKSRRIGATWGIAALAVLISAKPSTSGGQDSFYIGFNQDLARDFIDAAAEWARSFMDLAAEVDEFLFDDDGKAIQAFRLVFSSSHQLVALTSKPRSLRGRQGFVILDEAAFHDDLPGVLKAALALLMWGGKVLIISSHNGADHPFNELVEDVRAGRKPYALIRTTFADAIADGLFRRICTRLGKAYSTESEAEFVRGMYAKYGEDAGEELDVIPRASGGRWLPRTLLEARTGEATVVRWLLPDQFVDLSEEARLKECNDWLQDTVLPLLNGLTAVRSVVGEDFARTRNLTVMWPLLESATLERDTPFVLELHNVPFQQQEQVLFFLCDRLPKFGGVACDAGGNGQYLAERARQTYGPDYVAEVKLSEGWYRENMPPLKAALEDGTINLPKDAHVIDDLRSVEMVRGVARVPDKARKTETGDRHGDAAIALALAVFAARSLEGGPVDISVEGRFVSAEAFGGFGSGDLSQMTGFML